LASKYEFVKLYVLQVQVHVLGYVLMNKWICSNELRNRTF